MRLTSLLNGLTLICISTSLYIGDDEFNFGAGNGNGNCDAQLAGVKSKLDQCLSDISSFKFYINQYQNQINSLKQDNDSLKDKLTACQSGSGDNSKCQATVDDLTRQNRTLADENRGYKAKIDELNKYIEQLLKNQNNNSDCNKVVIQLREENANLNVKINTFNDHSVNC